MRFLRQSTSVDVPIGPFLDETDGDTPMTALTITQPDVRLKKNNGNWAQKNAAQTLAHEENGFYEVTLDTTDTNTLGLMRLAVLEAGALPVWEDFMVVTAAEFDRIFGSGNVPADVKAVNASTTAASKLASGAEGIVLVTVGAGSSQTSIVTNLSETTADHYNGAALTFITGALAGQRTRITDYDGAGALTVVQLTEAPGNGDLAVIT